MKRVIYLLTLTLFLVTQYDVSAQRGERHKERWEKYRTEKIAFLTTNLDLTPEEAQSFWPVYNQLDKVKSEAQQRRREIEQKLREAEETISDDEIIKLTREFSGNLEKEGKLMTEYNEKFLKILPPKKVLMLYKTEGEFRMYMMKKYRDQHKNKGDKHP